MGTRGPAPAKESQRRRANKPPRPVEHVDGAAAPPALNLPDPHPLAEDLFEAIKAGPEAPFMTPAAWQRARVSAYVLSQQLRRGEGPSAVMYTALQQDWKALLVDPAELRRLSIEVRKVDTSDPDEDAAVAELDAYRRARPS